MMRRRLWHVRGNGNRSHIVGRALGWFGQTAPARALPREYRVGSFIVQPDERRLVGHDGVLPLAARTFDLLLFFLENDGHLVSKDRLLATVWRGVVVEEANLYVHVCALRRILGQAAIETVPRHGYRFCTDVVTRSRVAAPATMTRLAAGVVIELDGDPRDIHG